ncbi:HMA2 domain-containing protein [Fusobacterium sp.]|uniref:HMA2 domain-containing protein n=1 Tax=Fusobacterium sp. TaxID=68766 RepID=UPI002635DCBF|nr:hypothetical protein [Fusobacterium sp.]
MDKLMPSFYGILEVKHRLPGRVRLQIDSLRGNEEVSKYLEEKLKSVNGIEKISVNSLVGSVLVKYDEKIIEPMFLIGIILNILGLEDKVFEKKSGTLHSVMKETVDMLDLTIYNKTKGILDLKTVIALFFMGYGFKKVRQNPIMPNGVNLLWWGYNLIIRGGN